MSEDFQTTNEEVLCDIYKAALPTSQHKKELFVRHKLRPLLLDLFAAVANVEFIHNTRLEYLRIVYKTGFIHDIEVTSRNERHITIAALKALR